MSAPIADGVMAATYKLVQQAMTGQWQEVPKTVEERRVLLQQLASTAQPQDQQWLSALRQAMAESDAAVSRMAPAEQVARSEASAPLSASPGSEPEATDAVRAVMAMLGKGG